MNESASMCLVIIELKITMKTRILILFLSCFSLQLVAETAEKSHFASINEPTAYIQAEQQAALEEGKNLLWVLGGDWCHDSRSLAAKLADEELQSIIENHFRLSMISVGYLDAGFEFTEVAGMSTFYATPTVLIIEPESMQQINTSDMHIWANAYNVSLADSIAYFKRYSEMKYSPAEKINPVKFEESRVLAEFKAKQEQRIRNSYKVLGPMLKEYKAGVKNPEFDKSWNALSNLRMALPEIISENREKIESGKTKDLDFSSEKLKSLPWEKEL